jgi:probable F420-dependent oxidoreductase
VEVGIGAGWKRAEHQRLGLPFPPAGERIARLAESLTIIKELLAVQATTFEGSYYRVHEQGDFPRAVQRPRPPVLVGGGGKRLLSLAAREADIVGLNPAHPPDGAGVLAGATAAATARKIAWIREAAGDRTGPPELNIRVYDAAVTRAWSGAAGQMASRSGLSLEDVLDSPHLLVGDVARVTDEIVRYRELYGISYFVVTTDAFRELAPVVARLAGK